MKIRLIIYLILTLIAACVFLFAPAFNWGGKPMVSMFAQYVAEGNILDLIARVSILSGIFFVGLLFLFGLDKKE